MEDEGIMCPVCGRWNTPEDFEEFGDKCCVECGQDLHDVDPDWWKKENP